MKTIQLWYLRLRLFSSIVWRHWEKDDGPLDAHVLIDWRMAWNIACNVWRKMPPWKVSWRVRRTWEGRPPPKGSRR